MLHTVAIVTHFPLLSCCFDTVHADISSTPEMYGRNWPAEWYRWPNASDSWTISGQYVCSFNSASLNSHRLILNTVVIVESEVSLSRLQLLPRSVLKAVKPYKCRSLVIMTTMMTLYIAHIRKCSKCTKQKCFQFVQRDVCIWMLCAVMGNCKN